jgi:hypothetical protein
LALSAPTAIGALENVSNVSAAADESAPTVKKKLSFALTSTKVAGDMRRYRIETRRGRRDGEASD